MKIKTLVLFVLVFGCNFLEAQTIQKVIFHLNGYQGNLSYRTGYPNYLNYHYFYVNSLCGDTAIYMESCAELYSIDNGSYAGRSSFAFKKTSDGIFEFTGEHSFASMDSTIENGQILPEITLQTAPLIINISDLTQPYWFSAFNLRKGDSTTLVKNFLYNDTSVVLIKGMEYRIGCTPGMPPNICMKYNCGDYVVVGNQQCTENGN